jgi:transposase
MDGIFYVLCAGCRWRALDGSGICNGARADRRFQQWREAGMLDALWEQALRDFDNDVGIDWSWLSIDGRSATPVGRRANRAESDRSRQARDRAQRDVRGRVRA